MLVRRLSRSVLQWCWFVLCLADFLLVSQLEVLGNSVPAMVNRSVTNLMSNAADLIAILTGTNADVFVCWDNIDCGTNLAAWKNQRAWAGVAAGTALTNRAYVLRPGTIYYYRWYATNSTSGAAAWSPGESFSTVARPLVGAIRWDDWVGDLAPDGLAVELSLAPPQWHYRLPYFGLEMDTNQVQVRATTQAAADRQIAFARAAGIDYWAFDMYEANAALTQYGLNLYLSSQYSQGVSFCMIVGNNLLYPSRWSTLTNRLINFFQRPNYQKVLGNRPLLFFLLSPQTTNSTGFATWADLRAAVDDLRAAAVQSGAGQLYGVSMNYDPGMARYYMTNLGLDAISSYALNHNDTNAPYAMLDAYARAWWERARAEEVPVLPTATVGWDRRPRVETPVPWEPWQDPGVGADLYYAAPTPTEWASHLEAAVDWVAANTTTCPAQAIITYAWNEIDEGGWLLPTYVEGTARLEAMRTVLHASPDGNFDGVDDLLQAWNAAQEIHLVKAGRQRRDAITMELVFGQELSAAVQKCANRSLA